MEVCSTLSGKVYLEAVLGTSNCILEIFNTSLLFSKIGCNSDVIDRISLNCSTVRLTISYALMISVVKPWS